MNDELLEMKNLGKTSVLWLHAVGIHSANELRRRGSVAAYRAVLARGFNASRVLLYSIEGALLDLHWSELPREHKSRLLDQLATLDPRNKS
ncbi:TfoX/Sxy family protein [Pseudomonas sp. MAP12]|uniref:TfoX/Sxy family protein n=1 Tax=Geopseudomonas aromaticivorans TaxID=2849492 RepID=A0ABS6N1R1_9GAMM|nr:TfoX/Sxy family protein [Pseudomonas aromaticivorans]MBV2134973.1 TfoX/Sxy family protein [Pseudomonas aromaticivorans]